MYSIDNTKVTKKKKHSLEIYIYIYRYLYSLDIHVYVYGWCGEGKGWAKGEGNKPTPQGLALTKVPRQGRKLEMCQSKDCHHNTSWTSRMQLNKCNHNSTFFQEGKHVQAKHRSCWTCARRMPSLLRVRKRNVHTHASEVGSSSLWKELMA